MGALAKGTIGAADVFGGALADLSPEFASAAAPFMASTLKDAETYHEKMRPLYASILQQAGARLLYVTPWPPTGLWSRRALGSTSDMSGMSIRTYDTLSRRVFNQAGAKASSLPFAELIPQLAQGKFDAVLSSGDGGMGKQLWQHLPYYHEINYAFPVSFTVISEAAYATLNLVQQRALVAAAGELESSRWSDLRARIAANEQRMTEHNVHVVKVVPADISEQLRSSAREVDKKSQTE